MIDTGPAVPLLLCRRAIASSVALDPPYNRPADAGHSRDLCLRCRRAPITAARQSGESRLIAFGVWPAVSLMPTRSAPAMPSKSALFTWRATRLAF